MSERAIKLKSTKKSLNGQNKAAIPTVAFKIKREMTLFVSCQAVIVEQFSFFPRPCFE